MGAIGKRSGIRRFGLLSTALNSLAEKIGQNRRGVVWGAQAGIGCVMTQSAKKGKRMVMLQKASHQMLQKQQHGMPRKVLHTLSLSMFSKGERGKGHEGMSQELYQALKAESVARRHPSGYMSRRYCGEVEGVIEAGVTVDAIWDAFGMCLDREPWRTSFFSRDFMEWQRHVVEKRRKNAKA